MLRVAAGLDLSPASISRIVRRLLAEGLVIEEPGPSDGVGRNRDVLRFNQRAGAVIAIDLRGTKCHRAVADLAGCIVAEDQRPTFAGGSPAGSLTDLAVPPNGLPFSPGAAGPSGWAPPAVSARSEAEV
ncbi:MAG: hypothetical protein ACRDOA_23945 [Streptosporangiaceae bacterium]